MASTVPSTPAGSLGSAPTTTPTGSSAPVPAPAPLSGSLHLTGTNRVPSVRVGDWTAEGFTKVVGNVEVRTAVMAGSSTVGGTLTAQRLSLSGTHRIEGEVRVSEALRSRGTFRTGAGVSAQSAHLAGTIEVAGNLTLSEGLEWNGALEVGQGVRAGAVLFRGQLSLKGDLVARTISGTVDRLSSVREIHADWVDIQRGKSGLPFPIFLLPPPAWHDLEVQRIEANEVHLAGVRVHHLKADRIWLGPHAHVEYVEGTIVEQHKQAHVGPESESPPPPGLNR